MASEFVLILPPDLMPAHVAETRYETPYGTAVGRTTPEGLTVLERSESVEARALIYAAKAMGARLVLAGETVQPVSPLLEQGDLVVPHDIIDQTRLRPFTFFVGKGYGFIKLNPPFCPDLMGALYDRAVQETPRTFRRATYVGLDGPRDTTPAEVQMYRHWGVDVSGTGLLPETYLARELELHYAALAAVGGGNLYPILAAVALGPVGRIPCTCEETMKFMKEQGAVGEDWRQW